ncbi:MAG: thiamine-phosphate kinase, partial [Pseudomonadota bacterium]
MSEFDLIRTLLDAAPAECLRSDVALGPGDDAALLTPPEGQLLATTSDTLIAGRHFPLNTDAEAIGHKSLAVNLSDLAAMGAEPAWLSLNLSLPDNEPDWLQGFARGFFALAARHGAALVGGDTTRGPLSISITATGFVPADTALRRSAARPGDDLYVSGSLGGAALALERLEQGGDHSRRALDWPQPRCELGLALRGLARAGIDLSDGLAADAGHIAKASAVALEVDVRALPVAPELADCD